MGEPAPMNSLRQYFDVEIQLIARLDLSKIELVVAQLARVRDEGRRVFLFGNGGSASTASSFACDLGKGTSQLGQPRFRVICLNDNMPTLSAYANDVGYDSVFAEPLISLAEPRDLVVTFSVSGNSPNVVRALQVAVQHELMTIAFTGSDGGKLKDYVTLHINIPSRLYGPVEDIHLALTHAICEMLKSQNRNVA
jgi:D-sedoheptulose 7-phosphate isomerase